MLLLLTSSSPVGLQIKNVKYIFLQTVFAFLGGGGGARVLRRIF